MSAERLRKVAAEMREKAPGPLHYTRSGHGNGSYASYSTGDLETSFSVHSNDDESAVLHADFMAAWPVVAPVVAEWLDQEAERWQGSVRATTRPSGGIDDPGGIFKHNPGRAVEVANGHARHALAVCDAWEGR